VRRRTLEDSMVEGLIAAEKPFREELAFVRQPELIQRARAAGVDGDTLEKAIASANRAALISSVVKAQLQGGTSGGSEPSDSAHKMSLADQEALRAELMAAPRRDLEERACIAGWSQSEQEMTLVSAKAPAPPSALAAAKEFVLECRAEGRPEAAPRWTITVKAPGMVDEVKATISQLEADLSHQAVDLPPKEQLLTFKGKPLEKGRALTDPSYGIQMDSILQLSQQTLVQVAEAHRRQEAEEKEKAKSRQYLSSLFAFTGPDENDTVDWKQIFDVVAGDTNQGVRRALNLNAAVDDAYRKDLEDVFMSMGDTRVGFPAFVKFMQGQFGDRIHGGEEATKPAEVPLPPAIPANPKDPSLHLFKAGVETKCDREWPSWQFTSRDRDAPEFAPQPSRLRGDVTREGGIYAQESLNQMVNDEPADSTPRRAMGDPRRWAQVCQEQSSVQDGVLASPWAESDEPCETLADPVKRLQGQSTDELQRILRTHGVDFSDCDDLPEQQLRERLVRRAVAAMHRDVAQDDEEDLAPGEEEFAARQPVKPEAIYVDPAHMVDNQGKFAGLVHPDAELAPVAQRQDEAPDDLLHASCFVFKRSNPVRRMCQEIVGNPVFEVLVICLIGANSVVLAMYDPLDPDSDSNKSLDELGNYFTVVFAGEMMLKIISFGFIAGEGAYLRTAWNVLDFIVVATGLPDLFGYESQFGVLRTVRLLRPLKTITVIRSMRVLVSSLLSAQTMKGIISVCTLMFFLLTIFGIIGVNLFGGVLRQRCINMDGLEVLDQKCTPDASGRMCETGSYCSRTDPITGLEFDNPNFNLVSFDDFAVSCLTIFTMLTLEGWTDVMYDVQDGFSPYSWAFFVVLIAFGSFIGVNLFLAVISSGYENVVDELDQEQEETDYAKACLQMITSAVYKSIYRDTQPTADTDVKADKTLRVRPGDTVELTATAAKKYTDMGVEMGNLRRASRNGPGRLGKIVMLSADNSRARVDVGVQPAMAKVSRFYWYAIDELQVVGVADTVEEEELEENPLKPSDRLVQERASNFFSFFDSSPDGSSDGVLERHEFFSGLTALCDQQSSVGKRKEDSVFIDDEVVRILLQLLTEEGKHGRDRLWQTRNLNYMFEAVDESGNGLITRTEFYNHFMDPEKWRVDEEEIVTWSSLSNENMRGKSFRYVIQMHCKWLVGKSWFDYFVSSVVLFNCIVLALESANAPASRVQLLDGLNLACTIFFIAEMVFKLFGLGCQATGQTGSIALTGSS
jgi:hypothetical protein